MPHAASQVSGATAAPTRLTSRPFTSLAGAVILLGLADSLVGAYFILFLANEAALSPLQIGLLFSLPTIGGIACGLYFGRRFDIRPPAPGPSSPPPPAPSATPC